MSWQAEIIIPLLTLLVVQPPLPQTKDQSANCDQIVWPNCDLIVCARKKVCDRLSHFKSVSEDSQSILTTSHLIQFKEICQISFFSFKLEFLALDQNDYFSFDFESKWCFDQKVLEGEKRTCLLQSSVVQFIKIPRRNALNLRSPLLCHDLSWQSAIRHSQSMFSLSAKKGANWSLKTNWILPTL